jgi:hypothetical protein
VAAVTGAQARNGLDQGLGLAQLGLIGDEVGDLTIEIGHGLVQPGQMTIQVDGQSGVVGLDATSALLLSHADQLVPAFVQQDQALASLIKRRRGPWPQRQAQARQHPGVDRVGLGQEAGGTSEVASLGGIDPRVPQAGRVQRLPQRHVVAACGLEDDEAALLSPAPDKSPDLVGLVSQPLASIQGGVEHVEMMLGHIDPDHIRVYGHRACPCDARSAATASCNCSGGSPKAGGDLAGLRSQDLGPNDLPPVTTLSQFQYTGTQGPSHCADDLRAARPGAAPSPLGPGSAALRASARDDGEA